MKENVRYFVTRGKPVTINRVIITEYLIFSTSYNGFQSVKLIIHVIQTVEIDQKLL
jgi:hypothetical protein